MRFRYFETWTFDEFQRVAWGLSRAPLLLLEGGRGRDHFHSLYIGQQRKQICRRAFFLLHVQYIMMSINFGWWLVSPLTRWYIFCRLSLCKLQRKSYDKPCYAVQNTSASNATQRKWKFFHTENVSNKTRYSAMTPIKSGLEMFKTVLIHAIEIFSAIILWKLLQNSLMQMENHSLNYWEKTPNWQQLSRVGHQSHW